MKVFADFTDNITRSRAADRIVTAIKRYAPETVTFVDSKDDANLVILYAYGRREHLKIEIDRLSDLKIPIVIVQLCVKSTRNPSVIDWLPLWQKAKFVWSYLDLNTFCHNEKISPHFPFYYAPLGVDDTFKFTPQKKEYVIASSSMGLLTESARECLLAATRVNRRVFHVGPIITHQQNVDFSNGMSDQDLAKKYAACEFVSGLRRNEGFELPVIEGLVCGARPIVFNRPEAHHWFDKLAVFIPETNRDGIINDLEKVFNKGAKPVTQAEMTETRRRFNWEIIMKGFWEQIT